MSLKEFLYNSCDGSDLIEVKSSAENEPIMGSIFYLCNDSVRIDEIRPCGDIVFILFSDIESVINHASGEQWIKP